MIEGTRPFCRDLCFNTLILGQVTFYLYISMKRALKSLVLFFMTYNFLFRRIVLYLQSEKTAIFFH